ncbi:hypothetical protein MYCO108962_22355 [Mycobacterium colombiense]
MSATVRVAATPTHSQGLRLERGGWPHGGVAPAFVQTGGPPHAAGCSPGAPAVRGCAAGGAGQPPRGGGAGAATGGPGAKPPAGWPANAAGGVAIWLRSKMSVARS